MSCRFIPLLIVLAGFVLAAAGARADTTFIVRRATLTDEKAVFATVESPNVVPARARIGGTVASLSVRQGDAVTQGQVIAVVADEKLLLQIRSLDAQIAGLQSQLAQAQTDLTRAETLFRQGAGPRTTLDQARTAVDVATSALRSRTAERAVAQQNLEEGQVLAPVAGRVITVPLTQGTVVLNGDTIATVGEAAVHAAPARAGAARGVAEGGRSGAHCCGPAWRRAVAPPACITLIYPQIDRGPRRGGREGRRPRQLFRRRPHPGRGSAPARAQGFVVPAEFPRTRFGLDYVSLRRPDGSVVECRCSAASRAPHRQCRTGSKCCRACDPATCWCSHDPRHRPP